MTAKEIVMRDKHWREIQKQSKEDILGMVMDFQNGRKTASELMNKIAEHCQLSFKAGVREVVEPSDELLEIGRKAIEDALVEWRDGRLSEFARGNGLVIREKDGKDSSIIRFGPETALRIGMKAMGQAKLKEWGIK